MWHLLLLVNTLLSFLQITNAQAVTCQPEQVHLSIQDEGTFVVTWATFNASASIVQYGMSPGSMEKSAQGSQEVFIDGGAEKRAQYIHRVAFPKLIEGSVFYYRVGSYECGWSDLFWFRTFPQQGTQWSPKFAVFGDMGNVNAVSLPYLQAESQSGMYDMILHVGDFAYDMFDENGQRGDEFMKQIEPIAAYVPYMTCPGNHEEAYNFSHYKHRFTMPDWKNGTTSQDSAMFYSFDLGPIHFISLNTEYYYYLNYGGHSVVRQYNWLIKDLEKANLAENRKNRPWVVIFGHRPMYCSDDDNDDCTKHETRTRVGLPVVHLFGIEELLLKYNVDLALWAHEHDFERFWPVYNLTVYNGSLTEPYTNPKAPVHIISGSAGCQEKHDPWLPKPDITAYRSDDYGYSRMTAHNATHLEIEQVSIDQGGKVIDHIWIIKDSHQFEVTHDDDGTVRVAA